MPDNLTIDAHQHYWQLGRFPYTWLKPELEPIYRDFLPADLVPLMQASGVARSVLVQADAGLDEVEWMLSLGEQHPQVAGVVGWADLMDPQLDHKLEKYRVHRNFKGVRPDVPHDVGSPVVKANLRCFARHSLSCDFLVRVETYPIVHELAKMHPDVRFILDHLAGVRVSPEGHPAWMERLKPLAELPNVVMKLSGYLSAAEPRPLSLETLRPYIEDALELFGVERLMFGSDWPVCTLGGPYEQAVGLLRSAVEGLSDAEKEAVWGGTAVKVYRLLA